jgi:hydrogenase maturation protease
MRPRILVAGIGNIFLGDDGFGVEVARRLASEPLPENVRVIDFGIRGFDLTMALLEDLDLVILVDAAPRGGSPGTLYLIEPDPETCNEPVDGCDMLDPHSLDPVKVLRLVKTMGGQPGRVLVVGCEPGNLASLEDWDVAPGLSNAVERAVAEAIDLIGSLIKERADSQLTPAATSLISPLSSRGVLP